MVSRSQLDAETGWLATVKPYGNVNVTWGSSKKYMHVCLEYFMTGRYLKVIQGPYKSCIKVRQGASWPVTPIALRRLEGTSRRFYATLRCFNDLRYLRIYFSKGTFKAPYLSQGASRYLKVP